MRKRLLLLWTPIVIGLALLLPASVLASSAQYVVLKNTCSNSGGSLGYGKSVITVEQDEYGKSGVHQFGQHAVVQEKYGGRWHTVDSFEWQYSQGFTNTRSNHSYTFTFSYSWGSDHLSYLSRLKWRGEWYDTYGNTIYYKNLVGFSC